MRLSRDFWGLAMAKRPCPDRLVTEDNGRTFLGTLVNGDAALHLFSILLGHLDPSNGPGVLCLLCRTARTLLIAVETPVKMEQRYEQWRRLQPVRTIKAVCPETTFVYGGTALESLYMCETTVSTLPWVFGMLATTDAVYITENSNLRRLPHAFWGIRCGNLYLRNNGLEELCPNFGWIQVDGDIDLGGNKLRALPDSMAELTVKKNLLLDRNELKSLPDNIGRLVVNGSLTLFGNKLGMLPTSFGDIHVYGDLRLNGNPELQVDPTTFCNLTVGGCLFLPDHLKEELSGCDFPNAPEVEFMWSTDVCSSQTLAVKCGDYRLVEWSTD